MEETSMMESDLLQQPRSAGQQPKQEMKKPLLSWKLHPGFLCFFQKWTEQAQITEYQCYQRVMKSNFVLDNLRWPTQKILSNSKLNLSQKSFKFYSRSSESERYYLQQADDSTVYRYNYGKDKSQAIKQLQMQVELYRRRREEALVAKRQEFKILRQEQEAILRRSQQQKQRRNRVLDKIQVQINQKKD